jgi:hypothetical protein
VRADLVSLRVASPVLRAAPREEAPVAARPPRGDQPPDAAWGERTVLACAGEWVKLRTEHGTGWAQRTCTAADESCP